MQKLRAAAGSLPSVTVRQGIVKRLINGGATSCLPSKDMCAPVCRGCLINIQLNAADQEKEWHDGEAVTGVLYKMSARDEELVAHAHLTVVCDGMYSTLRCAAACDADADCDMMLMGWAVLSQVMNADK